MTDARMLSLIAVIALCTALIRFLPFLVFPAGRTPAFITYLGRVLPYAAIGMLVVYCLRHLGFQAAARFVPEVVAGALVVLSYLWRRSTILSIAAGTACYMILVRVMV